MLARSWCSATMRAGLRGCEHLSVCKASFLLQSGNEVEAEWRAVARDAGGGDEGQAVVAGGHVASRPMPLLQRRAAARQLALSLCRRSAPRSQWDGVKKVLREDAADLPAAATCNDEQYATWSRALLHRRCFLRGWHSAIPAASHRAGGSLHAGGSLMTRHVSCSPPCHLPLPLHPIHLLSRVPAVPRFKSPFRFSAIHGVDCPRTRRLGTRGTRRAVPPTPPRSFL